MASCFVPGCKTSYRSCSVKANMFRAPADPVQLEQWRRAVTGTDRTLTSNDYICRLHFPPECIERSFDTDISRNTDGQDCRCPKLVEGVVPSMHLAAEKSDWKCFSCWCLLQSLADFDKMQVHSVANKFVTEQCKCFPLNLTWIVSVQYAVKFSPFAT